MVLISSLHFVEMNDIHNVLHYLPLSFLEWAFNTLKPPFRKRSFQMFFLEWKCMIFFIKISLKFVPKGQINNISALVEVMARRRSGDRLSSEPMMVRLTTHVCVTRPQWVNYLTHCGPATPSGDRDLGQYWRHQAITRTNVDWSSV